MINEVARAGVSPLPAASEKLSGLMTVQGFPESQSHLVTRAGSLGGEGGANESESEDETECVSEAVAVGKVAVHPAVAEESSGHGNEKNAKQVVKQD